MLVNNQLLEQYAMSISRWIQCEEAISEFGFLAKHPTTGNAIASPYMAMSQTYMKQVNQVWYQIYQIVKENCSVEYGGRSPQDDLILKPDTIVVLLKLDKNNKDKNISFVISEIMSCDKKYQRDVLEVLLRSEFSHEAYEVLQKILWSGTCSYSRSYGYVTVVKSIDPELGSKLFEAFMQHLENEPINVQENVVKEFIGDPGMLFNNYWDRIVEKIYRQYSFNNEDEIASFTYKYYKKKAIQQNIFNYKEYAVLYALKRCGFSDKKWKKAVERVSIIGNDKQLDADIRSIMKDVIRAAPSEGYIGGSESEKKSKFGVFFDEFKNRFKK